MNMHAFPPQRHSGSRLTLPFNDPAERVSLRSADLFNFDNQKELEHETHCLSENNLLSGAAVVLG